MTAIVGGAARQALQVDRRQRQRAGDLAEIVVENSPLT